MSCPYGNGVRRNKLQDSLPSFPEAEFNGINQPLADRGPHRQTVHKDINGLREIDLEERLWCRKLEDAPVLVQPIEPMLAKREQPWFE